MRLNPHQCSKPNFYCHWPNTTTTFVIMISSTDATATDTAFYLRFVPLAPLRLWHSIESTAVSEVKWYSETHSEDWENRILLFNSCFIANEVKNNGKMRVAINSFEYNGWNKIQPILNCMIKLLYIFKNKFDRNAVWKDTMNL